MSKIYFKVTLNVVAETELDSIEDVINNLDFSVTPISENVEVYETEVDNFF